MSSLARAAPAGAVSEMRRWAVLAVILAASVHS
jgi:hypothetical protein